LWREKPGACRRGGGHPLYGVRFVRAAPLLRALGSEQRAAITSDAR
jgi:hypothetical protein